MVRQVLSEDRQGLRSDDTARGDDLKSRIIKMIPGEIVAAYIACNTAITQFEGTDATYWIVFALIILLTPFYLRRIMQIKDLVQILIMCVAFILWCITLEQPFDQVFNDKNAQQLFSTLALTIFTFAVPIFYKGTEQKH